MKLRSFVAFTGAAAAGTMLTFMPTAQATSGATGGVMTATKAVAVKAAPSNCPAGDVCFYSQTNYKGSVCKWDVADSDTTSGSIRCSWMANGTAAKSVYNNGTSSDGSTGVAYYSKKNYQDRIGCTKNKSGGNLAGNYYPASLKWISTKCG